MSKRILLLLFAALLCCAVCGQTRTAKTQTEMSRICGTGWQVQHTTYSFDKQSAIVSALQPGQSNYDLYLLQLHQNKWSHPQPLPHSVNSTEDELWPSLSSDEQTLYLVRRSAASGKERKTRDRYTLMVSHREGNGWSTPQALIISDGEEVSPWIHPDGQTLFFASCRPVEGKKEAQFGIYHTRRIGQFNWYTPELVVFPGQRGVHLYGAELLEENGHLTLRYTQQVCEKKDTLYSFGQSLLPDHIRPLAVMTLTGIVTEAGSGRALPCDIQVFDAQTGNPISKLNANGNYRIALPAESNYMLDISADGHSHTYLHYDCRSLRQDTIVQRNVSLTPVLNIRAYVFDSESNLPLHEYHISAGDCPIRTRAGYSDLSLDIGKKHLVRLSQRGYADTTLVIDTRKPVLLSHSELDIEMRPGKAPLLIRVEDTNGEQLIDNAHVAIRNISRRENTCHTLETHVRQGDEYAIHCDAPGYVYADTLLHIPYSAEPVHCLIRLRSMQANMVVQLRNIQFEFDSYELLEESFAELDKVVNMLADNPGLQIELSAHTDDQGTDRYNDLLSQRRGETVRHYITRRGIAPNRIRAVGYGKRHPLVPNDSEENRAINRRVEFKITEL